MTEQQNQTGGQVARQHFRTTTLTVPKKQFEDLCQRPRDVGVWTSFVNDIVSSCRGENSDTVHHAIRRIDLLRNQWNGGYRKVNVRWAKDVSVACNLLTPPEGESDACSGQVLVTRISQETK